MYRNSKFRSASDRLILSQQNSQLQSRTSEFTKPAAEPSNKTNPIDDHQQNSDLSESEVLPASQSQEHTQRRYISQRSNAAHKSQSVRSLRRIPVNYFEAVLLKCETDLDHTDFYVLNSDHLSFVKKLKIELKINVDYPGNLTEFVDGVRNAMRDKQTFKKLLCGCLIRMPEADRVPQSQETIMKLFLMVEDLQAELIDLLLDEMKRHVLDEELTFTESTSISLILSQLKMVRTQNSQILFGKIFEVLELADERVRQDIIRSFEDVLEMSMHDAALTKLMDLMPNDAEFLTQLTVDTFGNMCLSKEVIRILRSKIVRFLKNGAPLALYPSLVKFLLKFDETEADLIPDLISDLREALQWRRAENNAKEIRTVQTSLFSFLVRSLVSKKAVFNGWLQAIQSIDDGSDHQPIDLIILIIMISTNDEKANSVENILKRRIKKELITTKLLKDTIDEMPHILLQHFRAFMQCIDNFFHDRDPIVSKFARSAYRLIFGLENCEHQKVLLKKLIGFVCEKHVDLPFCDVDVRTNALTLLQEAAEVHPLQMQTNAMQLLRILDRLDELTLHQFRMVLDLLCSVAYPPAPFPANEELQNHITMLVRKQVTSNDVVIKKQGIVGVTRVVDHTVWYTDEGNDESLNSSDSDKTHVSISEVPEGNARNALKLIELMVPSVRTTTETVAFAYDELACEFSPHNQRRKKNQKVMKPFLDYLEHQIADDFQTFFITDGTTTVSSEALVRKYCINEISSSNASINEIAINIGGLLSNEQVSRPQKSLTMLAPTFNLLRALAFSQKDGSLESINAVLGCAILVPEMMDTPDALDIFDAFPSSKSKLLLDCHFYVANWFRELISAFVHVSAQEFPIIRKTVKIRLSSLIKLEETIRILLKLAPSSYSPPACDFASTAAKNKADGLFKRPAEPRAGPSSKRKRKEKSQVADSENLTALNVSTTSNLDTTQQIISKKFGTQYGPREIYRQLDSNIMHLLAEDMAVGSLDLTFPLPEEKVGVVLGLSEIKFLLEDLTVKIEIATSVKKHNQQIIVSPSALVRDLIAILPNIVGFFEKFADHLKETLLASDDAVNHTSMFTGEIAYTKICFGLCLRLLAALFSWPDFGDEERQQLLKNSLLHVIHQETDSSTIKEIAVMALRRISAFAKVVLDIKSAIQMHRLCRAIEKFVEDEKEGHTIVVEQLNTFLSRHWYTLEGPHEQGASFNIALEELVQGLTKGATLETVQEHVKWLEAEIGLLKTNSSELKTFPCFNKANVPILFQALCKALISSIHDSVDSVSHSMRQLTMWETGVETIDRLLNIVKTIHIPRNFKTYLKYCTTFLKLFTQSSKVLDACLKKCPERVVRMLKKLQLTKMFLHQLCCQSKQIKDVSINNQIPTIRQTLEMLVFSVKAALVANNCENVFKMGKLQNRDLSGDSILSQVLFEAETQTIEVQRKPTKKRRTMLDEDGLLLSDGSIEERMLKLHGEVESEDDDEDVDESDDEEDM